MRLPSPLAAITNLFTARNWERVGMAEAFKRMCSAWAAVLLVLLTAWNAAIVLAD